MKREEKKKLEAKKKQKKTIRCSLPLSILANEYFENVPASQTLAYI